MTIDRLASTRRPELKVSGRQRWRDLLFLHWEVPYAALRPLVPPSLELDAFQGRYFVGLVPFAMFGVRPRLVPSPFGLDFLETNVRTYVHRRHEPGVFFFSLEAASRLAVQAARSMWGLPYYYSRMLLRRFGDCVHYEARRPRGDQAHLRVIYKHSDEGVVSEPDTLEHFLFERYLLFVERASGVFKGQVHHRPYRVAPAQVLELSETLLAASSISAKGPPLLSHYCPGVDVEVFGPWRC